MCFGSPDKTSTEYFSAIATAFSSSSGQGGGGSSHSITSTDNRAATQRKLAYPDELRRLPQDQQLILVETTNPIMARKIRWFEDADLITKGVNTHAE